MKFHIFLTAFIAALAAFVAKADVPHLYLVGEAAPSGWSRDTAPELSTTDNVHFTWTGTLGRGQFKFVKGRDTWDSYVSAVGDNCGVELRKPMPMADGGDDRKWYNNIPGDYILSVDLAQMTLTVTLDTGGVFDPENSGGIVVGQVELEPIEEGLYRYCGTMTPGSYRIAFSDGTLLRATGEDTYEVSDYPSRATTFSVASATDRMQLFVHRSTAHFTFQAYTPWEALYAVGSFNNWTFTHQCTLVAPDTYQFVEDITTDNGTEFKMVGNADYSQPYSIHPYTAEELLRPLTHFYTGGPVDNKWRIADNGRYTFRVNMYTREMQIDIKESTSVGTPNSVERVQITAANGILTILIPDDTVAHSSASPIKIYDLAGRTVVSLPYTPGRHDIPLPCGIYIVTTPTATPVKIRL